jgi:phage shock protein PspC (stress-responsive transcriptional regulator)
MIKEMLNMSKKFYRIKNGKMLLGVCSGLAEYFNVDVVIIRILWLILLFTFGSGFLLYFAIAFVSPAKKDPNY